tara:strand:- start:325 stop:1260 length:936 start_codon:yes stop_codon:yes gene_type:complete
MSSKRKIQINNKRNKKNKKTRKQRGGFGLGAALSAASSVGSALGGDMFEIMGLQMRVMRQWVNIQVILAKGNATEKDICKVTSDGLKDITQALNILIKKPGMNVFSVVIEELKKIQPLVEKCDVKGFKNTIIEKVQPIIAENISKLLPGMLKSALKGGAEQIKTLIGTAKAGGVDIPLNPEEVDGFIKNPFVQQVLADTPAPEASGDSGAASTGDSGAASTGDSGAASTGDSGAASTGSSSAPGSQYKDDPEKGVELAKEKIATHKKARNEAKVAKYEKSLEKYEAMVSGGGRTKRNKKNKKRKTIKIKCL